MIQSCHDLADGGLAIALAECCIMNKNNLLGLKAQIISDLPAHLLAFSESQSRFIVSVHPENKNSFEILLSKTGQSFTSLGNVGGNTFSLNDYFNFSLEELKEIYYSTISSIMNQQS